MVLSWKMTFILCSNHTFNVFWPDFGSTCSLKAQKYMPWYICFCGASQQWYILKKCILAICNFWGPLLFLVMLAVWDHFSSPGLWKLPLIIFPILRRYNEINHWIVIDITWSCLPIYLVKAYWYYCLPLITNFSGACIYMYICPYVTFTIQRAACLIS